MNSKKLRCIYDPLTELMQYYSSPVQKMKTISSEKELTIEEILKNRIIDGDKIGLEKDLEYALKKYSALDIINNILLEGMKVVGELFGSGQMQLPFVLQSAECMKTAVKYLEPYIEKTESTDSKGIMVLATVKGDVHDIGKNLVDIILTNNGYKVINLGIKCPLEKMLNAYFEYNADAIGMSGLLVKSTAIMKENLEQINERNLQIPVILGGAALNRRFVEEDLRSFYKGSVFYANDAFDGLKYMALITQSKNKKDLDRPINTTRSARRKKEISPIRETISARSTVSRNVPVPTPPFLGSRIVKNISLDLIFNYINEIALFRGSWNVYKDRTKPDAEYEELLKKEIYPKFNELKLLVKREKLFVPKVLYGYFPCQADGNDLIIYKPKNITESELYGIWVNYDFKDLTLNNLNEWVRFSFPRQNKGKFLCISDFFREKSQTELDVVAFQIVTIGSKATEYAQNLYKSDRYQEYLYFHGLSVETAEALAEYWHKVIRTELNIHYKDASDIKKLFQQGYQGSRYSFGYPACPNLDDNKILFKILKPERIGITLTEEFQMVPEQSTNAIVVHHPEAKYFFIRED
ncbi:MAG: vitamin B12 dependent-methionine synthase activation domain-containing protein [Ignavibacteria bacterium]